MEYHFPPSPSTVPLITAAEYRGILPTTELAVVGLLRTLTERLSAFTAMSLKEEEEPERVIVAADAL